MTKTSISGDELYNAIMAKIEPELLTTNLERIKELTKNETAEQRQERADRYSRAFQAYDEALKAHAKEWDMSLKNYKKNALKSLETHMLSDETNAMNSLESSIQAQ